MQVLVNTDKNIPGGEGLPGQVEQAVEQTLGRFSRWLTRVEVHLSDHNSQKGGSADKRCLIEARAAGRQPVVVTAEADSVGKALDGALDKMRRLLDSEQGRLDERASRAPTGG